MESIVNDTESSSSEEFFDAEGKLLVYDLKVDIKLFLFFLL